MQTVISGLFFNTWIYYHTYVLYLNPEIGAIYIDSMKVSWFRSNHSLIHGSQNPDLRIININSVEVPWSRSNYAMIYKSSTLNLEAVVQWYLKVCSLIDEWSSYENLTPDLGAINVHYKKDSWSRSNYVTICESLFPKPRAIVLWKLSFWCRSTHSMKVLWPSRNHPMIYKSLTSNPGAIILRPIIQVKCLTI